MRAVVKIPLMVTGGLRSRVAMDAVLADGAADVIGLGRPLCYQPDGPARLLAGATTLPSKERELALFDHAHALAAGIGFELIGVKTGGGSDGNFTAPYAATLDGLGVDGKGAHTDYEQINIDTIVPRAEFLRQLLMTLE